jgi:hypothetical protein
MHITIVHSFEGLGKSPSMTDLQLNIDCSVLIQYVNYGLNPTSCGDVNSSSLTLPSANPSQSTSPKLFNLLPAIVDYPHHKEAAPK